MGNFTMFPAGTHAKAGEFQPGDFILTHGVGIPSRLIRFGTRLRFHGPERAKYAHWSHAAIIVDKDGCLVEANARGVELGNLLDYDDVEYMLVRIGSVVRDFEDRERAAEFARSCVGHAYGYLTFFGIALGCLTGGSLTLGYKAQEICSGLVARALERTWAIFPRMTEDMMPADLYEYFDGLDAART